MTVFSPGLGQPEMIGMSHWYTVAIDNIRYDFGSWAKVSGLTVTWEVCELRTGDSPNQAIGFPGHTKYEKITLSRAACAQSRAVQQWLIQTSQNPQPQSGAIQLLDSTGTGLVEWRLNEFFPVGWSITDFDTGGGKPVMETLSLMHSGFLGDQVSLYSAF